MRIATIERFIIEGEGFSNIVTYRSDGLRQAQCSGFLGDGFNCVPRIIKYVNVKTTLSKEDGISPLSASEFENLGLTFFFE